MDGNSTNKNESVTSSLMDLLKKYTTRIDEREPLVKENTYTNPSIVTTSTDPTKDLPNKSQPKINSNLPIDLEKASINYKAKWEESETKYRLLEIKYQQLENGTIKQFQEKIDQLQRESNQIKIIKERITQICSCRQLTHQQFEQLKLLVNEKNLPIESIANKNDFLQQTRKLREIFLKHNEELLTKIDQIIKKKRKRNEYEEHSTDQDTNE